VGVRSTTKKTKRPPEYRVLIHNDNFNRREYVVQVLLKARALALSPLLDPGSADSCSE
jgi:ATP-dependent Clp protease adapter protein ClpS